MCFYMFVFLFLFMIPWDIPTSDEEIPRLTHIYRNQHFLVWLAAMDLESKVDRNGCFHNHYHYALGWLFFHFQTKGYLYSSNH